MPEIDDVGFAQFSVDWSARADLSPSFWNQVMLQPGLPVLNGQNDGAYLTFGQINPPYIPDEVVASGIPEDQRVLHVQPVASLVCSRERMIELYNLISNYLNGTEPNPEPEAPATEES